MTPQLLIAGHIVKDRTSTGWQLGGGALYAAAQAARLGIVTAAVTACEPDVEPSHLVPAIEWRIRRVDTGIRFENTYDSGHRTQRLLSTGSALGLEDIPAAWRLAPLILLSPVFHDIDPGLPARLVKKGTKVGIGAQGWLRGLAGERVIPSRVDPVPEWLHGDVVFLSEEDVIEPEQAEQWRDRVATVVLTRGRDGYTVWDALGRHDIAPSAGCEVDPTGAGDIFAAAYMVRFGETGDVLEAARFAAAAAALSVEGCGIEAVGTRAQIEARLGAGVSR